MACKDKKQPTIQMFEGTARAIPGVPSDKDVRKELRQVSIIDSFKNQKRILPKTDLLEGRISALGKKLVVIETSNFGPPLIQRKINGVLISPQGTEIRDNFRLNSGMYWTTTDDEKALIYLNESESTARHRIVDYSFSFPSVTTPRAITADVGYLNSKTIVPVDELIADINKENKDSFFGTQQRVLIRAQESHFMVKSNSQANGQKPVGKVATIGNISQQTPFTKASAENKEDQTNLVFSEEAWKLYVEGGQLGEDIFKGIVAPGIHYFDHTYEISLPFSKREVEDKGVSIKPLVANIEPVYNFFIEKYENTIRKIPEVLLPNIYVLASVFDEGEEDKEKIDMITLAGSLKLNESAMKEFGQKSHIDMKTINGQYFEKFAREYEKYKVDPKKSKEERINFLSKKFSRQGISVENINILSKYADKRFIYPMYTNIQFSTDRETIVAQILKDSNLSSLLMKNIIKAEAINKGFLIDRFIEAQEILEQRQNSFGSTKTKSRWNFSYQRRRKWDITKWVNDFDKPESVTAITPRSGPILAGEDSMFDSSRISSNGTSTAPRNESARGSNAKGTLSPFGGEDFSRPTGEQFEGTATALPGVEMFGGVATAIPGTKDVVVGSRQNERADITTARPANPAAAPEETTMDIGVFLGSYNNDVAASNNPQMKFFRSLMKIIFMGKIRKLIKDKFRTFEELMSGKLAYSETVMYRVEKSYADSSGLPIGKPIQNFYFPNSNEIDIIQFIDSQVKYKTRYVYRVFAYQVVIGTRYHYDKLQREGKYASFLVTQQPAIAMVETPYYRFDGLVMDSPPVSPEIEVVPYKDKKDRMLFLFQGGIGDYRLKPITFSEEEKNKIKDLRMAQQIGEDELLRYKSDDHTGFFQVFRTETKPEKYEDFSGKQIASINTDVNMETLQKATSAAFINRITPNKDYWYTFRTVDNHGHISNPSPVYKIKMVEDSGAIYPLIEIVEFSEKIKKSPVKSGRKYVYIAPALTQQLINEEKSGIEDVESVKGVKNIHLGISDETIWDKTFVVRFVSKKTGKKADLRVVFKNNFVKSEPQKMSGE